MKVSIIIPVFNKIEIVEECIKLNIIHSNFENEWIIIDNNSNDTTKQGLQRLKQFAQSKNHSFEIITEIENTGVAKAWNKGLRFAKQEYICILNNDCVMMSGWDEGLINANRKFEIAISTPFVLEPWMFKNNYSLDIFLKGNYNWEFFKNKNRSRVKYGVFTGVVFFGEKSYFEQIGNFDEVFWLSLEEYDYLLRARDLGLKTATIGSVVAFHYAGLTRNHMKTDGGVANQKYFQEKWGWNFELTEQAFPNKQIKSIQKFMFKQFGLMSTLNFIFPKKNSK